MNNPESLRGSGPEPVPAYGALTYSGSHAAQPRRAGSAGSPPAGSDEMRERNESSPPWRAAKFVGQQLFKTYENSVPSGSILRRHWPRKISFSVNSGVSGPLQSMPPAASRSHTQCAWQYQSRQLPGCWSRSTVIRPSGTSTSTVGLVSANGNAAYSASLASVAGFVIRFAMSNQGSSSYSVTTVVTLVQPWSARSTTSRAPMPGSRSRRADTSTAWCSVRSGGDRSSSRAPLVHRALCAPPSTYTSWLSPDQPAGRTRSTPFPVVSERIAPLAGSSTT